MAASLESSFELLQAAAIDGRTSNVRYRQNELHSLHAVLRSNADAICTAIKKDSQNRDSDSISESEYYLAMDAITHFYEGLDFDKALVTEYLISTGADNPNRRVGKGIVVIRPTAHTRFYSIICPLAAAIAAGNCVCLELDTTLLSVDSILKSLLLQALDSGTFAIASKDLSKLEGLSSCFIVDQVGSSDSVLVGLRSDPRARTVAIVDRTADIDVAAKALVRSRFNFQGTSPYSPDLVIVNEFYKAKFFDACTREATSFFARRVSGGTLDSNAIATTRKDVKEAENQRQLSVFGSPDFMLLDISNKSSAILGKKISGCFLPILTSTSMADALRTVTGTTLLATYIFAEPSAAKFLSEHISSRISIVNQIPPHLLVGPAAPIGFKTEYNHRYNAEMFSTPSPQYILPPISRLDDIKELFNNTSKSDSKTKFQELRNRAIKNLSPTGQKPGDAIGFFEQGVLVGAGLVLLVAVPTLAYGTWIVGRKGFQLTMALGRQR